MKKGFTAFFCICLLLSGCQNQSNPNNYFNEDYSIYYQYTNAFKGLEIYAWNDKESNWFTVLMQGTNRWKTIQEVKELQDNSPCPIDVMKTILDYYRSIGSYDFLLAIVSNPPKEEELMHNQDTSSQEYILVSSKLGIPIE